VPDDLAHKFNVAMAILPPREKNFVIEYLVDYNGTRAAGAAGYTGNNTVLSQQASKLLKTRRIKEAMAFAHEARHIASGVDGSRTLVELMRIGFIDPADIYDENGGILPLTEMPENVRRAISWVEVEEIFEGRGKTRKLVGYNKKVWFHSKNQALEMLGKHQGLFPIHGKLDVNVRGKVDVELKLDFSKLSLDEMRQFRDLYMKAAPEGIAVGVN